MYCHVADTVKQKVRDVPGNERADLPQDMKLLLLPFKVKAAMLTVANPYAT